MERFETELGYIANPEIRAWAKKCVDQIPEYFFHAPASSTGKYHPSYALGDGGLYRHTKAAVHIARDILNLEQYGCFSQDDKDYAIMALILHDSRKSGEFEGYTKFEHPMLASEAVQKIVPHDIAERVCPLIESHMGQWNTSNRSSIVLPTPKSTLQQIVHLADYLASRKYLVVPFDGNEVMI